MNISFKKLLLILIFITSTQLSSMVSVSHVPRSRIIITPVEALVRAINHDNLLEVQRSLAIIDLTRIKDADIDRLEVAAQDVRKRRAEQVNLAVLNSFKRPAEQKALSGESEALAAQRIEILNLLKRAIPGLDYNPLRGYTTDEAVISALRDAHNEFVDLEELVLPAAEADSKAVTTIAANMATMSLAQDGSSERSLSRSLLSTPILTPRSAGTGFDSPRGRTIIELLESGPRASGFSRTGTSVPVAMSVSREAFTPASGTPRADGSLE